MKLSLMVWQMKELQVKRLKIWEFTAGCISIWRLKSQKIMKVGLRERQNKVLNSLLKEGRNMGGLKTITGNSRWYNRWHMLQRSWASEGERRRNSLSRLAGARRVATTCRPLIIWCVGGKKPVSYWEGGWKSSLHQWQRGFRELIQMIHFQGCSRRVWENGVVGKLQMYRKIWRWV